MPLGPRLAGSRIYLRGLSENDAGPSYVAWLADPEVNRYLETRHVEQTREGIATYIIEKNRSDEETLFGIFLLDESRHIGNIKLGPVRQRHLLADVSLFIGDRALWGRGYASEAITAVARYAMESLALNKLCAGMYAENLASIRAFTRAGWEVEGRLRAHYLLAGEPSDVVLMGFTRSDYQARRR